MKPKSDTLFHFTKSLEHLKSILANGFYPRYCLEDTSMLDVDYVAYPMICFCDIPISRLSDHTSFYGDYGIGITKEWGARNLLHPVSYVTAGGPIVELANFLATVDIKAKTKAQREVDDELVLHFNRLIPLLKPLTGKMLIGGKAVEKDFYQENEWRFLPEDFRMAFGEANFAKQRAELNLEVQKFVQKFMPSDIRYIFVKSDSELPIIFDFIQNNLGAFPLNEIKILSTRITSLETLSRDL